MRRWRSILSFHDSSPPIYTLFWFHNGTVTSSVEILTPNSREIWQRNHHWSEVRYLPEKEMDMVILFIALEDLVKVLGSILPQLSAINEIHNVIIFSVGLPSKCLLRIAIDTKQRSEYRLAKGFLDRRNSEHWLTANLSNHCRWLYFDRIPRLWQRLLQHPLCQRFGAIRPTGTRSESIW